MKKPGNLRTSIQFTKRTREMIDDLMEKTGFASMSSLIAHSISIVHKKEFPTYLQNNPTRQLSPALMTPEQKAQRYEDDIEAKKIAKRNRFMRVAEKLDGKIVISHGTEMCHYYTYSHTKRYLQEIPLMELSDVLIEKQYSPSKEKVEILQQEGRCEYMNDNADPDPDPDVTIK